MAVRMSMTEASSDPTQSLPKPAGHFISIGHSAWDRTYRVRQLPAPPSKIRALEHIENGGGTAANAAASIARLGGTIAFWSRVGDDNFGAQVIAELDGIGVDTQHVLHHEGSRTSTSVVIVDQRGERLVISERDHAMPVQADWLPLDRIDAQSFVLSDLTWREGTLAAFRKARSLGAVTLVDLDIAGGIPAQEILQLTDYAVASKGALQEFFPASSVKEQLESLLSKGPRYAGVTLGENGYHWRTKSGTGGRLPAYKVEVVDTTGAGDAFHGALAFAIACGMTDEMSARFAAATAALKCRRLGARTGLPSCQDVMDFLSAA